LLHRTIEGDSLVEIRCTEGEITPPEMDWIEFQRARGRLG